MAKYDWNKLEKEYILGDYKNVSSFLEDKKIPNNGTTRKQTTGWSDKKRQKDEKIKTKTIEKVIEKESKKEAQQIVNVKNTAELLLSKIYESVDELNKYFSRNTKKTKVVEYDYDIGKPNKEIIEENEEIKEFSSIIDKNGLKQLTSSLKDINDILVDKETPNDNGVINDLIGALNEYKKNR